MKKTTRNLNKKDTRRILRNISKAYSKICPFTKVFTLEEAESIIEICNKSREGQKLIFLYTKAAAEQKPLSDYLEGFEGRPLYIRIDGYREPLGNNTKWPKPKLRVGANNDMHLGRNIDPTSLECLKENEQ